MRIFRAVLAILLWVLILLCIAATVVPQYLDRIYYRGATSDHFGGEYFFNPSGDDDRIHVTKPADRVRFMWRQVFGDDTRPVWPKHVDVAKGKPPATVSDGAMLATWIGHASVLVQADGVNILTDPVWSDRAGPYGIGPRRVAAPGVDLEDLPKIDVVVISHNHYDHMDLATLKKLWARDKPMIVTSLGNDAVLGTAGLPARALDWGNRVELRPGVWVQVTRNHHWSSRWFKDRNRALWSSFVVGLPSGNFFFAGDTGIGDGKWPAEAASLGTIRFAAIPIGAFRFVEGEMGIGSHIGPKDAIRVWDSLGRPPSLPMHWGTFRLSREAYRTPPDLLAAMFSCAGAPATNFAEQAIGVSFAVPPLGPRPNAPDFKAIEACIEAGKFDHLR